MMRGLRPVILGDRWDACAPFLSRVSDVAASCLVRVKAHRVFSRPAPARQPGQRGASRTDGARFQCHDPPTHEEPETRWEGPDDTGTRVEMRWWSHLHLRQAREIDVSVRHGASERPRDPKISGCVWKGDANEPALLATISPISRLRSAHEHGFRLDQQVLMWDTPRLRTPAQTVRWTQMGACAHKQLVLARPWETRRSVLTLAHVRRAMLSFLTPLGTPTAPTRKSAWTCERLPSQARYKAWRDSKNEHQAENEQNGNARLSLSD